MFPRLPATTRDADVKEDHAGKRRVYPEQEVVSSRSTRLGFGEKGRQDTGRALAPGEASAL